METITLHGVALVQEEAQLHHKHYFFIAGLPRSGSTLLSSILSQNPKCYAGITSPVYSFVSSMLQVSQNGTNHVITEDNKKEIIKSIFDIVYKDKPNEIIFDTNRAWPLNLEMLHDIMPSVKIICCVRSIDDILNSFETLYRKKLYSTPTEIYGSAYQTVHARCNSLMSWDGLVGFSLNALKQGIHSTTPGSMMFLEYDSLIADPDRTLDEIYKFLGIEPFQHTFNNLSQIDDGGCDSDVLLPGLHTVKPTITTDQNHMLLPYDIIELYRDKEYWRNFYEI